MGLFSFPGKNKQDTDDDLDMPVKPRRSRRSQSQDEEPMDPMLPEKQRARRRLIGATALVLAAIIGLPMIFDADPNKPLADDVETQIPDKLSPPSEDAARTPPAPHPAVTQKSVNVPAPDAMPVPETVKKPQSRSDTADRPAAEIPQEKIAEKTAQKTAEKTAENTPVKTAERKASADESTSQTKEKARKYVLQIAAVNSKTKAEELQNRLKQSGIKTYSEKVSTKEGERIRVRVGPFASREEAEKMRARVKKAGLNGNVQSL